MLALRARGVLLPTLMVRNNRLFVKKQSRVLVISNDAGHVKGVLILFLSD
jgi:hypothetical protein